MRYHVKLRKAVDEKLNFQVLVFGIFRWFFLSFTALSAERPQFVCKRMNKRRIKFLKNPYFSLVFPKRKTHVSGTKSVHSSEIKEVHDLCKGIPKCLDEIEKKNVFIGIQNSTLLGHIIKHKPLNFWIVEFVIIQIGCNSKISLPQLFKYKYKHFEVSTSGNWLLLWEASLVVVNNSLRGRGLKSASAAASDGLTLELVRSEKISLAHLWAGLYLERPQLSYLLYAL